MTNEVETNKKIDEIENKYKEKEAEIQEKISIEFDSMLNDIYSKYEKDYRDMGNVKKEKRNLKGRISELKYVLKIFKKEISILTKNKKKLLKQKLNELRNQKEAEIKKFDKKYSLLYNSYTIFNIYLVSYLSDIYSFCFYSL